MGSLVGTLAEMEADGINWDVIVDNLPITDSERDLERIQEMWDLFNVNDAKGLNVFEVENGIVDMTQTGDSFDSQKAINDAFNIASKAKYEKEKVMEDKLEMKQFRLFLRTLRMTYNFYEAFNYVDSDGTHIISKEDFLNEETKKVLEKWLGPKDNWEEEFDSIDMTNKKGEDAVLFVEFFAWAEPKSMNYMGTWASTIRIFAALRNPSKLNYFLVGQHYLSFC